jgi:excisionase family DNA binding protein
MFAEVLPDNQPPQFVDTEGLAEVLKVSTDKVGDLCKEKRIPFLMLGRRTRRFHLPTVLRALEQEISQ